MRSRSSLDTLDSLDCRAPNLLSGKPWLIFFFHSSSFRIFTSLILYIPVIYVRMLGFDKMPKSDELYPRKVPHLQFKILGLIALRGRLSQKEAATSLQCKAPTISEAFKIMINRTELIKT